MRQFLRNICVSPANAIPVNFQFHCLRCGPFVVGKIDVCLASRGRDARGKLPDIEYLDQDDLGGWGQNRFKELLRMCKPDQIATVLLDILETGSPYQKQNAALIFNWHVLKGFGPGMDMLRMQLYDSDGRWSRELTLSDPPPHEIKCGPNQQVVRYDVLDNQPSSLGPECCYYLQYKSWPTHASLGEEVGLILYLVLGIPESRPASSLEGILRALKKLNFNATN